MVLYAFLQHPKRSLQAPLSYDSAAGLNDPSGPKIKVGTEDFACSSVRASLQQENQLSLSNSILELHEPFLQSQYHDWNPSAIF